jgi:hypothetical protein
MKIALLIASIFAVSAFGQNLGTSPQAEAPKPTNPSPTASAPAPAASAARPAANKDSIGGQIAEAVETGLGALDEKTLETAKSDAGKIAVSLIVWKVVTRDVGAACERVLQVVVGVPLLGFGNWLLVWFWRRNMNAIKGVDDSGKVTEYLPWFIKSNSSPSDRIGFTICWWAFLLVFNLAVIHGVIF